MSSSTEHPANEQLRQYAQGLLDEESSQVIDAHLEHCERCTDRLEQIAESDSPLLSAIQVAWQWSEPSSVSSGWDETMDCDSITLAPRDEHHTVTTLGKYEVIDELGRGGMGVVYKALDSELKREVALKVIIAGEHSSLTQRERFRREAETIASLNHHGIVQIYEVGDFDGQPFLALELISGPNLSEVTNSEPQPVWWSAAITLQLSQAIHYAHQQSVIHRDLKPGNVLVALEGSSDASVTPRSGEFRQPELEIPVTKITDFGLAKQLDSEEQMTKTGHAMGTPAYMSPEQAAGNSSEIGPATDIYALGAMLYELLTGMPPIKGPDPVSTLIAVIETEASSPREYRAEIPRDLETICMKCLMKHPSDRYESARDLGQDLELFLAGEPILARRPNLFRRLYRWARHYPQLAISYLACVACYGLHLVAKHVLEMPFHVGDFGAYAPYLLLSWAGLTTLCETLGRRFDQVEIGQYGFMGITIAWMSIMFSFDAGPRTAPIPLFFVLIASSTLIVPKSAMLWFVTMLCSLSYAVLAFHSHFVTGRGTVGLDEGIGFFGSLIMMGVTMQLVLRRASRRVIRDDQWKTASGSTRVDRESRESK